ncbi:MAG: hypothetical protein COZ12_03240 [Deltaproteobacteria bacterium CG_4_10_14_3_um_filter_60_8]|nr:MAG: hypothetical protein AUK28_08515 [Desulfobacterales bacterium CG2_30_60_27]PIP43477.1 MAG: hypothetical protein COX17_06795 [Deltaproteobacteria bacterium CG23_combo_of_CG06-09_8_20_14_all_60_8]PIY22353.1 MAG: hypothetical protein COZ12_03240 [Deltaproteobacteria bacterium CG_4_10_14_3_um_filter_60_8]
MQTSHALQEQVFPTIIQIVNGPDILPFRTEGGEPTFSDTHLAQVFRRLVREETLAKVFYDGAIVNTTDFINFFHNQENEIFFVQEKSREVGFFWLNRFRHKSAFITYCFYRDFRGRHTLGISRATLDFLFSRTDHYGEHLTDVLLGLTPADNKLAVKFLLKNNMTILGRVPGFLYDHRQGKSVDGILSYRQRQNAAVRLPSLFFVL